jgi:hypothetical protein
MASFYRQIYSEKFKFCFRNINLEKFSACAKLHRLKFTAQRPRKYLQFYLQNCFCRSRPQSARFEALFVSSSIRFFTDVTTPLVLVVYKSVVIRILMIARPLHFFESYQQTALLGIVAAQALAAVDLNICLLHLRKDHFLQLLRRTFIHAMGDAHLAFIQPIVLQMGQNRRQRFFHTTTLVDGLQRSLVAGFANDPDSQNARDFRHSGGYSAVGSKVFQ